MASLIYNSFWFDVFTDAINLGTDTLYTMLVTSSYTENKDNHLKRSDITNEVTGTGYTAGGIAQPYTVSKDNNTDQIIVTFSAISWPNTAITARKAITYKRRGGAAAADELVYCNDFGTDQTTGPSPLGTFPISTNIIRLNN